METYSIEATVFEPGVELNFRENKFFFIGESRPENVKTFYSPIIEKINQYKAYLQSTPTAVVECVFQFDYFNSASSKCILDIIEHFSQIKKSIPTITLIINWHYDALDDDMKEAGLEFEEITELKFNFCENN